MSYGFIGHPLSCDSLGFGPHSRRSGRAAPSHSRPASGLQVSGTMLQVPSDALETNSHVSVGHLLMIEHITGSGQLARAASGCPGSLT